MVDRSYHRTITDDLLDVAVRIKRDAGVGHTQIQGVVEQFASQAQWQERTGGIGFPLVEDIPQQRRGDFLAALAELQPHPDRKPAPPVRGRMLSATEVWPSRVL